MGSGRGEAPATVGEPSIGSVGRSFTGGDRVVGYIDDDPLQTFANQFHRFQYEIEAMPSRSISTLSDDSDEPQIALAILEVRCRTGFMQITACTRRVQPITTLLIQQSDELNTERAYHTMPHLSLSPFPLPMRLLKVFLCSLWHCCQ